MRERLLTVTELTAHIKNVLEHDPLLDGITVSGEISNYKTYPSGHHYFSLKDAESSVRCVMFRSSAQRLRFRPENGMSVAVTGRIAVYPRDGAYQLYCISLAPLGTGDLFAAFERLKARLAAEGLFDPAHKKPLPRIPERIAVITSPAGAAIRDVLRILKARWPSTSVVVIPVRVQGVEAPGEIAAAIRYANRYDVADLIITGRGGGSMEDLWAFNDERVARAIYDSEIPVISAVGHEPDFTISDFVADLRAATPSNAAELAVPDQNEVRDMLRDREIRLHRTVQNHLTRQRALLDAFGHRRALTDPMAFLSLKRMDLDRMQKQLLGAEETRLQLRRHQLGSAASALDAMSPLKVLSRGYAVAVRENGEVVRSARSLETGETIRLRLADGAAHCKVEKKEIPNGSNEYEI